MSIRSVIVFIVHSAPFINIGVESANQAVTIDFVDRFDLGLACSHVVVPCTLLPYDPTFEMGTTLASAAGVVKLNHPHCAKFCVLGGGSCSR